MSFFTIFLLLLTIGLSLSMPVESSQGLYESVENEPDPNNVLLLKISTDKEAALLFNNASYCSDNRVTKTHFLR